MGHPRARGRHRSEATSVAVGFREVIAAGMNRACQPDGGDAASGLPETSTSLKWGEDGELSPVDLQRVLARLTEPSLISCELEPGQTDPAGS